jgi:regulator of protease activity HflC (stomatin/prohibitin superfamily)
MFLDFLGSITGLFVVVYDGQHALKFTLGRAKNVVGPGVHFKVPIIQKYDLEETKHTTLDLEPQTIQLKDDLVYEVDCKVMYRIVDLRKAIVEIDELTTGLENRVVMTVQRVVQAQDRVTVRDTQAIVEGIRAGLEPLEEEWGVQILQVGFSNISPSPATLEITQLQLLAEERIGLYHEFRESGLAPDSAVALITGAVVATGNSIAEPSLIERKEELRQAEAQAALVTELMGKKKKSKADDTSDEEDEAEDDEEETEEE